MAAPFSKEAWPTLQNEPHTVNVGDLYLKDGNPSFQGGQDAGRLPADIDRDQYASAINATCRNGPLTPRPGWFNWGVIFQPTAQDALNAFQTGFFQDASFYKCPGGDPMLISSHGGRQFAIDLISLETNQWNGTAVVPIPNAQEITPKAALQEWTTAAFTIPAVSTLGSPIPVTVAVSDTSRMSLLYNSLTIGGYQFLILSIPDSTHIQVINSIASQVGIIVGSVLTTASFTVPATDALVGITLVSDQQLSLDYPQLTVTNGATTQQMTLTTLGVNGSSAVTSFTIPAVGANGNAVLASTAGMSISDPYIYIAGQPFTLQSISGDGVTITVTNVNATGAGTVYTSASNVVCKFTIPGNTVTAENPVATGAGTVFPIGSTVSFLSPVVYTGVDLNNSNNQLNWSIQADQWWILQDNASLPIIFDGAKATRANPATSQIPTGNVMCYAQGRILVALSDRQTYMASDLIFGPSGSQNYGFRDAILYFTENQYLNEGGELQARVFGAPSNSGDIKSMTALAQTDSSLGQGSVIIGTPQVMFSVNLPFDRTTWKNTTNPLQTVVPIIGPTGQNSTVQVNSDLWYRSLDGIRSYMIAQRQFNGSWGNTAMSNELDDLLGLDTDDWIEHASSVLFDGRLLVTISPQMSAQGVFFRGLAVMDFNPVTSLRKKGSPCWEGIWTGWYPAAGQAPALGVLKLVTATVNNQERCFMYVLNSSSQIELWELSTEDKFDQGNSQVPIPWQVELPSYTCGDGDRFKTLEAGRMLVSAVSGQFYYNCQYRTDEWPCWVGWQSGTCCSQNQDCGPFLCTGPKVYLDQPRRPIRLAQPPDDFNKVTNILNRCGYEIQPRLQLVGYAAIKDFKVFCRDTTDMLSVDRSDDEICSSVTVGPPGQSVTYLTDAFGNYLTDAYGNRLTK